MHFGTAPNNIDEFMDMLTRAMLREKILRYRVRDGMVMALTQLFKK